MDSVMIIIGPVNEIVEIGPTTTLRDLLPGTPRNPRPHKIHKNKQHQTPAHVPADPSVPPVPLVCVQKSTNGTVCACTRTSSRSPSRKRTSTV